MRKELDSMPKMKSKSSLKKRIKITGTGKVKHMKMFVGCKHIRSSKSPKQVRSYRKDAVISPTDLKRLKKAIPGI